MPGQDEKESDDGMWLVTMGAFKLDLLVYAAIGTKVDVFHKEQRRSGPFGWSGPLVDKWVPGNADSIRINNTYYGATAANANYLGQGACPPPGEPSGQRPSLDCRLWAFGTSVSYTFDQAVGLSGSGPGGLPPNPGPGGGAKLDVRAVSGIASVTIGTWQPVLSVQSAGFPPEWVPPEGQALTSAPPEVDAGKRVTCVRLDSEGRVAEVGGAEKDGARWWLSRADAITALDMGYAFFVERPEGDRVAVELALSRSGREYLKTEADGDAPKNLWALPRC